MPKDYAGDGEDFSGALRGRGVTRTRPLFWEYGRNDTSFAFPAGPNRSPGVARREGDWKLLVNADGTGGELYNLAVDRNETSNLVAGKPDLAKRLIAAALAWRGTLP